jgi:hypothetical protein
MQRFKAILIVSHCILLNIWLIKIDLSPARGVVELTRLRAGKVLTKEEISEVEIIKAQFNSKRKSALAEGGP